MKTTKKQITATLRSMNTTAIYELCYKLTGSRRAYDVCNFVKQNAPTKRIARNAYDIAYGLHDKRLANKEYKGNHGVFEPLPRQRAFGYIQYECNRKADNYTKVPIYGNTWLYLAHPYYKHSDYNKSRILPMQGNERFCELLVNYAKKHFNFKF